MGGLSEAGGRRRRRSREEARQGQLREAASLPLAGLTALQALREAAALRQASACLIHAGAGGVGSLAIQIAEGTGLVGRHSPRRGRTSSSCAAWGPIW